MTARFYNQAGTLVWECRKDARYELNKGTKAIKKGAVRGELYCTLGIKIDELEYYTYKR